MLAKYPLTLGMFSHSLSPFPMATPSSVISPLPRVPIVFSPDSAVSGGSGIRRNDSSWRRFIWSFDEGSTSTISAQGDDLIRPATREEGEDVLRTILLSISMDSSWNDSYAQAEQYLTAAVGRIFNEEDPLCLVIQKGSRLIAASLLDPEAASMNHLVSGPAVTMEYRNRGIGSRLLQESLGALRARGLKRIIGLTRDRTVAARHVYTKFGSVSESFLFSGAAGGSGEAKA